MPSIAEMELEISLLEKTPFYDQLMDEWENRDTRDMLIKRATRQDVQDAITVNDLEVVDSRRIYATISQAINIVRDREDPRRSNIATETSEMPAIEAEVHHTGPIYTDLHPEVLDQEEELRADTGQFNPVTELLAPEENFIP